MKSAKEWGDKLNKNPIEKPAVTWSSKAPELQTRIGNVVKPSKHYVEKLTRRTTARTQPNDELKTKLEDYRTIETVKNLKSIKN